MTKSIMHNDGRMSSLEFQHVEYINHITHNIWHQRILTCRQEHSFWNNPPLSCPPTTGDSWRSLIHPVQSGNAGRRATTRTRTTRRRLTGTKTARIHCHPHFKPPRVRHEG